MSAAGSASVAGAVAVSTAAQLVAKIAHLGLNIVASLALIRYLQPDGYGDYVFVLSFAALFGLLSDLGMAKIAVRESSRDEASAPAILGTAIVGRLLLAVVAMVLVQLALAILAERAEIRVAIAVASLMYVTEAFLTVVVVFQVRLQMQYEALVTVVVQAIDTVLILVLIGAGASLVQLIAAPVASGAVGCVFAFVIVRGRFGARVTFDRHRLAGLLWESAPIGITLLIAVAYLKLDSVMLGILATPVDVGLYGSAFKPVEYLLLAAGILVTPLFPLLSRWYAQDRSRFSFLYWRASDALLAIWLPVAVLLFWTAQPLVSGVYGAAFSDAAFPLRVLAVALVLMVISGWQSFALLAAGRQRLTVAYDFVALALNVALNLALIPRYGYVGAAFTALATSAFVVVCSSVVARRVLDPRGTRPRFAQIIAANMVLGILVGGVVYAGMPWWLVLVAAPLPYAGLVLLFRVTTLDELRLFVPARRVGPGAALAEVAR